MPLNNTPKPTGSVNNTVRVSDSETWGTITTTWASETRTWLGTGSRIDNTARVSPSMNNTPKP